MKCLKFGRLLGLCGAFTPPACNYLLIRAKVRWRRLKNAFSSFVKNGISSMLATTLVILLSRDQTTSFAQNDTQFEIFSKSVLP